MPDIRSTKRIKALSSERGTKIKAIQGKESPEKDADSKYPQYGH